jgi:hypothetical protein
VVSPAAISPMRALTGVTSLPGRNIDDSNTTLDASAGKPRPAKALSTTPSKPARVMVMVGIPSSSTSAAARPHS